MRVSPPLPRLLLIADGFASGRDGLDGAMVRRRVVEAVRGGVRWVQLRDHGAGEAAFASEAARLAADLRAEAADIILQVNTRAAEATRLAAGLHVGRRGPAVGAATRLAPAGPVTAAVHHLEAAQDAAAAGADAVLFSPVYPTASKRGSLPAGLDALRAVCAGVGVPVLALGGVTPARVAPCLASGAWGVAVLSGILGADDASAAAAAYRDALAASL